MRKAFQESLIWHMDAAEVSIADLSSGSGVPVDAIKKLRRSAPYSTTLENGMAIAAYFGKSAEAFISRSEPGADEDAVSALFALLSDEEARLLLAQVRGVLRERGVKAK